MTSENYEKNKITGKSEKIENSKNLQNSQNLRNRKTINIDKIQNKIKQFVIESADFQEFDSKLKSLKSSAVKGAAQEVFAMYYFRSHAVHHNVAKYYARICDDIIPEYVHNRDVGTDGIIEHSDGMVSLVQVKFRSDNRFNLRRDCLSGMSLEAIALGQKFKHLYLFSNTESSPKMITAEENRYIKYILYGELASCNWALLQSYVDSVDISHEISHDYHDKHHSNYDVYLRKWQEEALAHVFSCECARCTSGYFPSQLKSFLNKNPEKAAEKCRRDCEFGRKQVVAACGAGKSIFAAKVAERYFTVLVVVPNLHLLAQWFDVLACEYPDRNYCLVGSDMDEEGVKVPYSLTTDPKEIYKVVEQGYCVCISTYQSLDKVRDMYENECGVKFDLCVCDEAHVTVVSSGSKDSNFAMPTSASFFARNVLFITATPRVYKGKSESICSMDDQEVFGDRYSYSFRNAIADGVISDYNIVVGISNNVLKDNGSKNVIAGDTFEADFMISAINEYKINSLLVCSSNHSQSKQLYESFKAKCGGKIPHEIVLMKRGATSKDKSMAAAKVNSGKPVIIFNVRVFSIGSDMPRLESVMISGNKTSVIDIVQTVSRCLRLHPGKKTAYILIPCVIEDYRKFDSEGGWLQMRSFLAAMSTVDREITEEVIAAGSCKGRAAGNHRITFHTVFSNSDDSELESSNSKSSNSESSNSDDSELEKLEKKLENFKLISFNKMLDSQEFSPKAKFVKLVEYCKAEGKLPRRCVVVDGAKIGLFLHSLLSDSQFRAFRQEMVSELLEVESVKEALEAMIESGKHEGQSHWIVRVGDGSKFDKQSVTSKWNVKKSMNTSKYFTKNAKPGDVMWFLRCGAGGLVTAIGHYTHSEDSETEKVYNQELHFDRIIDTEKLEIKLQIVGPIGLRAYKPGYNCNVDLPEKYAEIMESE